ncbi:hypothetical protein TSOC_006272, partial [Tetrabaena socialis]
MPQRRGASPFPLPPPPPPRPPPPPPLSFNRWFARRARACDLLLLLLEVLTMSATHTAQLMFGRVCVPVGGGPHAALQELPLHPDLHRADALLAAFPCAASYAGRLLYVIRTAAAFDSRVALRLTDYGLLGFMLGQLASLAVLLASPWLYEQTRRGLLFVQSAAVLLGCLASAVWTPAALLPLVSAALLGAGRRRMGAVFFAWKAATADRAIETYDAQARGEAPGRSGQWRVIRLLFGPALWLLAVITTHFLDRRLLPPGASQPQHLQALHAALLFVVVAVLPYLAGRCYKRAWLRPQYIAYLLDRGSKNIRVVSSKGETRNASKNGSTGERSGGDVGGGCSTRSSGSTKGGSSCGDILAGSGGRGGGSGGGNAKGGGGGGAAAAIDSIPPLPTGRSPLYPLRRDGFVRVHLISGKVVLPEGSHTSGGLSFEATAALAQNAAAAAASAQAGGGGPVRFTLLSILCIKGCVHVLMMVRHAGDGSGSSLRTHHAKIEEAEVGAGGIGAAVESACSLLLTDASGGEGGGGSSAALQPAPSAFAWPPVLPMSAAAEGGAAASYLLLLPTPSLAGLGAVRCVVAGPASQPQQRQQVHVDGTLAIASAYTDSAERGGHMVLRLQLPPVALRASGALSVFVLPSSSAVDALEASSVADAAPLAALPLLALPAAAAAEVRQLYGEVLGQEVYGSLQQLLLEENTAGGGPDGWRLAASASAAAASASAAIRQSGLASLSHDIGALLQLPASAAVEAFERGAGDGDGGGAQEEQLPFEAWSSADLLRFLASQRMGACLREGLRALRRAGVQLAYADYAFTDGGGVGALEAAALQLIREAGKADAERSYQAFKAARCWRVNLLAFALMVAVRLAACLRTLRAVRAAETAPMPAAADGLGAGRLTELQQQLLAQALFVAAGFITALAFGTALLRRRRTALLLTYKALLDPLSSCLVMWPPAWGGPLLRTPDAWLDGCRRYELHWLCQSQLLQLSPLHQLWAALAGLLPMTLY